MTELGKKYEDRITGFSGIAIGRVVYITGCNQVLIAPPISADGALRDSAWFDEQRLKTLDGKQIQLDNGDTPGACQQAPIK
jgi:hypothetical protein